MSKRQHLLACLLGLVALCAAAGRVHADETLT
jgi:hypothetical protein